MSNDEADLKARVAELSGMNTILKLINESTDSKSLLKPVFSELCTLAGVNAALLHTLDESGMLNLSASRDVPETLKEKIIAVEPGSGVIGRASETGEIQFIENVEKYGGRVKPFWEDPELKSGMAVPVKEGDSCIAVMTFGAEDEDFFADVKVKTISRIITQIETGIAKLSGAVQTGEQESELKTGRSASARLIETIADGIILIDADGVVIAANKGLEYTTGYKKMDILGRPIEKILPSWIQFDDSRIKLRITVKLEEKNSFSDTFQLIGKDENNFNALVEVHFLDEDVESAYRGIVVIRKMSKPQKAEGEIWQSEALVRTLADSSPYGILACNLDGVITHENPSIANRYGFGPVTEKNFSDLVSPEEGVRAINLFKNLVNEENIIGEEIAFQRKSGARFIGQVNASLVRDQEGVPQGAVITVSDITEFKLAARGEEAINLKDSLTGCYNKTYFNDEMARLAKDIKRSLPLSILTMDIQGVEMVNEIFGKDAGDDILVDASLIFCKPFRKIDTVTRIGGNRFSVILPGVGLNKAIEKKNTLIELSEKYSEENKTIPLLVSVGVSSMEDEHEGTVYDLYQASEQNLYESLYSQQMNPALRVFNLLMEHMELKGYLVREPGSTLFDTMGKIISSIDLSDTELQNLQLLTHSHNMGYIIVSDEIIEKPEELSQKELESIRKHPETGCNIATNSIEYASVAPLILHHHERWDGKGYPSGLKGKRIPRECRIFALADAYAAMISPRPYRQELTPEQALTELLENAGTQFDPDIVEEIVSILSE